MENVPERLKKVVDVNGNEIYLESFIAPPGGQGVVCRSMDYNLAVKFLLEDDQVVEDVNVYEGFKNKIDEVSIMRFDDDIHICKPEVMLKAPLCGYVMKLLSGLQSVNNLVYIPDSESNFESFLLETGGLRKRLEVLIELSRTLARIHSKGIVYCDVSPTNVYYSPSEVFSKVWLIDCDNLKFSSDAKKAIFTPRYGAPEVVNGSSGNTIFSDCYSFAVLAFRILTSKHPFELDYADDLSSGGWDDTVVNDLVIENEGKWIGSNMSMELRSFLGNFLTKQLFNLFDETFNDTGRKLPSSRPSMRKWYDELKRTYSLINKCECGGYSYTNVNSAVKKQCLLCGKDIQVNGKIRLFSGNTIVKNAINEKFMNEINNDINEDDDFYFREEMADKFVKELEYKLIMEFPIYSGLKLYDFNLDEVTIDRMPSEVVDFKIVGDSLIIDSKEQLYQKISDHELKKIAKPYKLIKGESCMIVLKRDVEKIMYVMFE